MATERIYTIPLRKEWLKSPKYRRAKKAGTALREFLVKHMKSQDVKIGRYLNLHLWEHGIKNPPSMVKVKVTKEDNGKVYAELVDAPAEKKENVEEKVKKAERKVEARETEQADVGSEVQEAKIVSETKEKKAPSKKKAAKKE